MPKARFRATSVAALVIAAALAFATPAGASRAANAKERRALTNAVHVSPWAASTRCRGAITG